MLWLANHKPCPPEGPPWGEEMREEVKRRKEVQRREEKTLLHTQPLWE